MLTKVNFRNLVGLDKAVDGLFGWNGFPVMSEWTPSIDVVEEKDAITLEAEVPGISVEDIELKVENGILQLSGKKELRKEKEGKNYNKVERYSGSFSRSFILPDGVVAEDISASFDKGVLFIRIPKKEKEEKLIRIEVKG